MKRYACSWRHSEQSDPRKGMIWYNPTKAGFLKVHGGSMQRPKRIAIDGPAGSGKSTVGEQLAQRLGYLYIDTGAMYRAVAWLALKLGIDINDGPALEQLAQN